MWYTLHIGVTLAITFDNIVTFFTLSHETVFAINLLLGLILFSSISIYLHCTQKIYTGDQPGTKC